MPTLTTHNTYLFVASVKDVVKGVPDIDRLIFRKLHPAERLTLQGFRKELALQLGTKTLQAAGNAYPPPLIISVLWPMLDALAKSNIDFVNWPPSHLVSNEIPHDIIDTARRCMAARPRKAVKKASGKAHPRPSLKRKHSFYE